MDCLQEHLVSYPSFRLTDQVVSSWFINFQSLDLETFAEGLKTAIRNSKTSFAPTPSDVQSAINEARNYGTTSIYPIYHTSVSYDKECGMDKVITKKEFLNAKGKLETEIRISHRATLSDFEKMLLINFKNNIFCEEWETDSGRWAYNWKRNPLSEIDRTVTVEGRDIPIYAR